MNSMKKVAPAKTTAKTIKTASSETPQSSSLPETRNTSDDHFTLRIPRLQFKDGSLNVYLVFVLIIFAFILGMLTNKVLYLEKQIKDASTAPTAAADTQAGAPTAAPPPEVVDVDNGKLPLKGDANAPVTIVEFSDFQCPYCKQYFDNTHGEIDKQYVQTGKVKFAYRHFPLSSIHPNAEIAAEASECANEQDKFWDFHDKLFENQDTWSPQTLSDAEASFVGYAGDLGLNTDQFQSCLDDGKYKQNVQDDLAAGNAVQVDGTPAFFVNGHRLVGAQPFSEFQKLIDEQLKNK
jgi:protein-disulfide isomerase